MRLPAHDYLDSMSVPYEAVSFPEDTEKVVANVAQVLGRGLTPRQIVKSLIFETSKRELVMVLLGSDQNAISGQLKRAIGDRNIKLASPERVREVSGYEIGAIPPFGWQPAGFRTLLDAAVTAESLVAVGAGRWGYEILLTPPDLARAASARIANLTIAEPRP